MKRDGVPRRETELLRERISRLCAAVVQVNASLDVETVLRSIVENACALSGAPYGLIVTVHEDGQPAECVTAGFTAAEFEAIMTWPDGPQAFEFFREVRGVCEVDNLPIGTRKWVKSQGLDRSRTFLGMPLYHLDKQVGHFYLMCKEDDSRFTSEDEETLRLFASLAATTIANARTHHNEQRARAGLEALVEMSPVGVLVLDAKSGSPILVNQEAKRLVDYLCAAAGSPGRRVSELRIRRSDGKEVLLSEAVLAHLLSCVEPVRGEKIELTILEGPTVTAVANARPITAPDGVIESVIVTLQDLKPLRESARVEDQYIELVSHELRAPLTSIKGSTATALQGSRTLDRADALQFLRIIDTQADHMSGLISDLLDAGRIESGTLSVHAEPVEVAAVAEQARSMFLGNRSGNPLQFNLASDLPRVMADKQRIAQVLCNLFDNAARHSPEHAPIRVLAKREGDVVAISVADEGRGLPPELLPRLFEKRTRLSGDKSHGVEGTGLGLAICKGIVDAHGGQIRAESKGTGQGAVFSFTLPAVAQDVAGKGAARGGQRRKSVRSEFPSPRILVVEDDPFALRSIRELLKAEGFAPIATGNPADVPGLIAKEQPQLVLLDLMLPGTDGIELMEQIPQMADLPVIIISGYDKDETIARALDAGALDYVVKPLSRTELAARIRSALRVRGLPHRFTLEDLSIDFDKREVTVSGKELHLTSTEFELLRVLSHNAGSLVTYGDLISTVWEDQSNSHPGLVRSAVMKLRRKLGDDPARPVYIYNVHGVGYKMPDSGAG